MTHDENDEIRRAYSAPVVAGLLACSDRRIVEMARRIARSPRSLWGPDPEVVFREALSIEAELRRTDREPREWERDTSITSIVETARANVRRRAA